MPDFPKPGINFFDITTLLKDPAGLKAIIDEFTKPINQSVQNMLHPLFEKANPRLGDNPLPVYNNQPSIVFLTGNLSTDGVGDNLKAHSRNRLVPITIKKPDADEWIEWALDNDIAPEVLLTVKQFPQMLASFEDFDKASDNEYIYDPRTPRPAFCTPRSLNKASDIVKKAKPLGMDILAHALKGTIGNRATYDMLSIIQLTDELPTWEQIVKEPTKTKVPDSASAVCMLVYSAIQQVEKDNLHYLS